MLETCWRGCHCLPIRLRETRAEGGALRLSLLESCQVGLDLVVLIILALDVVIDAGNFLQELSLAGLNRSVLCVKVRYLLFVGYL